jgi:hypothetical protein
MTCSCTKTGRKSNEKDGGTGGSDRSVSSATIRLIRSGFPKYGLSGCIPAAVKSARFRTFFGSRPHAAIANLLTARLQSAPSSNWY